MQKIFVRYFVLIMVITVTLTLLANFALQTFFSQNKAEKEADAMSEEIFGRISDNDKEIHNLTVNLNENYIARAKAFAEIIAQTPEIIESQEEMFRIAEVLNVEEVHVTDEKGILRWGNVPLYYGLDFATTEQTKPFLPALTDKDFALAQEPQLNGSIGKLFQYISVARQDKSGIVQVGIAPEILDNALANNKINNVIANYNVDKGETVIAIDPKTSTVVGDSEKQWVGESCNKIGISDDDLQGKNHSKWITQEDGKVFAVFVKEKNYCMAVTFTKSYLFNERKNQSAAAAVSSILLGLTIIASIFILLKRRIINDMDQVNDDLKKITNSDLNVVITAKSTPEFVTLGTGINEMVGSLKQQMDEISKQSQELEENNENILASLNYARKIQKNLLPSSMPFDESFRDYSVLWEPKDVVGGDIYWMKTFPQGAVLCVCDCTGHGTPGALLTMLAATILDTVVHEDNCQDTAGILWEFDQRLVNVLHNAEEKTDISIHEGADLAILFIPKDGDIHFSSAKLQIFICDGNNVENIRGQRISIGDGSLSGKEKIKTISIPRIKGNAYYIVSDGLFDQIGGDGCIPFGYKSFKQIILAHHFVSQSEITNEIWQSFQCYMGSEIRRDDVTLISFKL